MSSYLATLFSDILWCLLSPSPLLKLSEEGDGGNWGKPLPAEAQPHHLCGQRGLSRPPHQLPRGLRSLANREDGKNQEAGNPSLPQSAVTEGSFSGGGNPTTAHSPRRSRGPSEQSPVVWENPTNKADTGRTENKKNSLQWCCWCLRFCTPHYISTSLMYVVYSKLPFI